MSTTIPTANARLVWTAQPDPGGAGNICTDDILQILGPAGNVVSWIDYLGFGGGDLAGGGSGTVQQILAGTGISIGGTTANPVVTNTGVTNLAVGAGLSENASSGFVTIANTGVTALAVGQGLKESASTGGVTLTNTQPTPWVDIQNYGGIPKPNSLITAVTSVNTTGGLPNITVGSALPYFVNGAGICIWKAGAATSQSTPSAPSVTSPAVSGSQTITYQVVGVDSLGGLTAASASGTIATAPAIFGSKPQAITSATASGGVVTLNFSTPLNNTVVANMTIHVVGLTGGGATWNGIWNVASAPTTSQITYNVNGATGSSTVTNATGRLSNTQLITAISRASTGIITVTTSQSHNFHAGTTAQPTIVIIEGVQPYDLCGHFVIASTPSGTTFTCNTGNMIPETGSLNTNGQVISVGQSISAASATVWEYTYINCPAYAGTTNAYYIYSDNLAPGGAMALIGKTLPGERHFTDWGPNYGSGFIAPAYVPTAPPVSAQNQMFSTTILSGGGTTSMILSANVPTTVSGGTIMYDDGPCLLLACNALPVSGGTGGQVIISPPQPFNSLVTPEYVFNSPTTIPTKREIVVASALRINETIGLTNYDSILGSRSAIFCVGGEFSAFMAPEIFGQASPMIQFGGISGQTSGTHLENLFVVCNGNGQNGIVLNECFYNQIRDCVFSASTSNGGTNVALTFNGPGVSTEMRNCTFAGTGAYGQSQLAGQSFLGPCVGSVVFRAADNPNFQNLGIDKFVLNGVNTGAGRGIMFDGQYGFVGEALDFQINQVWIQGSTTPSIMFYGYGVGASSPTYVRIHDITNDSSSTAILANWSGSIRLAEVDDSNTANQIFPLVTGNAIQGLVVSAFGAQSVGQTVNTTKFITGASNVGSVTNPPPQSVLFENSTAHSLGVGGAIFAPVLPTSASLAAASSGAGTIPAATYPVNVTFVGWDGGETAPQETVNVTVDGSHGIQVSWTQPSGFQGTYIYINNVRNSTVYTSSPQTFSSISAFVNSAITQVDGTGLPLINTVEVITPILIMPSGVNKLTAIAPTMTGNRNFLLADGSQSSIIPGDLSTSGSTTTTVTMQGVTASSHVTFSPTNAAATTMMLTAPGIYISSITANTVVFTHAASLAGATFQIQATVN